MSQYAAKTSVSVAKSKAEIESILNKYGATEFAYGTKPGVAAIGFVAHGKQIRFTLPLPDIENFRATTQGRRRTQAAANQHLDQATRQRWRALTLMVKAKLEAVESGIVTFEQEFLAHIVLPNGSTVYDNVAIGVEEAYQVGTVQPLLEIEGERHDG